MKKILLRSRTKKKIYTLVDDSDYERLTKYNWYLTTSGYVRHHYWVGKRSDCIQMHRLLLSAPQGMQVDHINGNKLDNRRYNLRLCSNSQNGFNRKAYKTNTSGYKGVYFCKQKNKWIAQLSVNGRHISVGAFMSAKDASIAYNKKAKEVHGRFYYSGKLCEQEK